MSDNMIKTIKNIDPPYIYRQIIAYINKNPMEYYKFDDSNMRKMIGEIIKKMAKFSKGMDIIIEDYDKEDLNIIYNNFENIIDWHKKFPSFNQRKECIENLRVLLFSKEGEKVKSNFRNENEETKGNFSINDFILNYTLKAIEYVFNNNFNDKDIKVLDNTYLYFVFKINDPESIINLKVLTYQYLYSNKNYKQFIKESLKYINQKKKSDNETLKNFIKEKDELDDIDIIEVSDNMKSFFNNKGVKKSFKFFKAQNIDNNYTKFDSDRKKPEGISRKNIAINPLKFDEKKISLFSPEFLISLGLKSQIQLNDLEIFNTDNFNVEVFAKFILEIIENINDSINKNNFSTDFIKKNMIKFNELEFNHYISAKLTYDHIKDLESRDLNNLKANKIIYAKLEYKGENREEKSKIEEDIINQEKDANEKEISILSKTLLSDFNKNYSDFFEDIIEKRLVNFIEKEKLIYLPNILFMLNLKIPKITEDKKLEFESVHLDFFIDEKKSVNDNYIYGCKEIDTIFKNDSDKSSNIFDQKYFSINLGYIRNKNETKFKAISEENLTIRPKSIIFGEIKKAFPNFKKGSENVLIAKIQSIKPEKNYLKEYIGEDDPLYPYYTQVVKLIKKFRYFWSSIEEITNKDKLTIHLLLLYDNFNMKEKKINFNFIKNLTERILTNYGSRIENIGTIIFQLVFFNNLLLDKDKEKIYQETKEIISKKDEEIQAEKNNRKKIEEENNQLQNDKRKLQDDNEKLQDDKKKLQDVNEKLQDDKKKLQDVNEKLQDDNGKLQQTIEFQNKIIALLNIKDLSEEERNKKMKELKLRYNQK